MDAIDIIVPGDGYDETSREEAIDQIVPETC